MKTSLVTALLLLPGATAWVPPAARRSSALVRMGKASADADADAPAPEVHLEPIGSVCEFDDGKHDRILLGVVTSAAGKAKGGTVYQLEDADGKTHSVHGKQIHAAFGPGAGKEKDVAKILSAYQEVAQKAPTDLGVEPELLEMAWELCAFTEAKDVSAKGILSVIDENLYKSSVDKYKAFRLLTSDLGKVFFKTLSNNRYKVKAEKAVASSKEQWCKQLEGDEDWCFVA